MLQEVVLAVKAVKVQLQRLVWKVMLILVTLAQSLCALAAVYSPSTAALATPPPTTSLPACRIHSWRA